MRKNITVLLVDDDALMREWLRFILSDRGYIVVGEAEEGGAAIALCAELKPDLILLDINMPGINGLDALKDIHSVSPTSKVLMISGEATMKNYDEAIAKGAAGFVVKPFNVDKTLEMIDGFFSGEK